MAKKSSCVKGQRYSKKFGCKVPCKSPMKRHPKSGDCYKPKSTGKRLGRKKCGSGQVYVKKAGQCMTRCSKGMRRQRKSPFYCQSPKTRKRSGGIMFTI